MDHDTMQDMINSGIAWQLEGSYGRAAMAAIETGECVLGHEGHSDAYGGYVPSRYEVEPGTKGSPEYAGQSVDRGTPVDYRVTFGDGSSHVIDSAQLFGAFAKKHLARFSPVTVLSYS